MATFVSSGMKDAGYLYVNLDDCWMDGRDSGGKIQVNSSKFPSGMAALAEYIHDKSLKIGLYSTPGTKTCANIFSGYSGGLGSLGHETSDAQSYASWHSRTAGRLARPEPPGLGEEAVGKQSGGGGALQPRLQCRFDHGCLALVQKKD